MTRTKIIVAISLALVGAALAASAAQAERPDDRTGMHGVGAVSTDAAETAHSAVVRPDDRGAARGPGTIASPPLLTATGRTAGELEWRDASLGAAAMLVAVLLAGGIAHTLRDRRRYLLCKPPFHDRGSGNTEFLEKESGRLLKDRQAGRSDKGRSCQDFFGKQHSLRSVRHRVNLYAPFWR